MAEEQKPEPKISLVEAILIGIALFLVSIVNLIPLVGDITSPIVGSLMAFYLYMKGLRGTSVVVTNAIGYACGLVPILQALPTELFAWVVTVWIDRHPELEKATEMAGAAKGGRGSVGSAETEATETTGATRHSASVETETAGSAGGAGRTRGAGNMSGAGEEGSPNNKEDESGVGISDEVFGMEKEPIEKTKEDLFNPKEEQAGQIQKDEKIEEENNEANNKIPSPEEKAERTKKEQLKLPDLKEVGE